MLFWVIKILVFFFGLCLLLAIAFVTYGTITDYKPNKPESLTLYGRGDAVQSDVFTFASWNMGFTGLGCESDFFLDGGKWVITPEEFVDKNRQGAADTMQQLKDVDFILIQEIDEWAKRSYYHNHLKQFARILPRHNYAFATNLRVWIPYPVLNPLGRILSGIATFTKFRPTENTRFPFVGNFWWPKSLYFPDRCMLLQRLPLKNDKELVVINTHNSAYDDGRLKKQQMDYMHRIFTAEYEKGNYVVAGGDWNLNPPGYDNLHFWKEGMDISPQIPIEPDYLPKGWQWVFDLNVPTNRKSSKPYVKGKTFTTIIDFFLISPNIELQEVKGIDQDFAYSDHQPVCMKVRLR